MIRRELMVAEGDAYNRVLVDRSKQRVRSLGFFKDVDIQQEPGSAPDKTVLRVVVTEQPTGELSFSLGYSSVDQVVADIGISERNFRGRGQQLTFRVSAGYLRQEISVGFTEPHFLGRNLSGGYNIYATRYDFSTQASYQTTSAGASISLGFPLTDTSRLAGTYSLHADRITVDDSFCIPGQETVSRTLCDQRGSTLTSDIGFIYRLDHRDDTIKPTKGFYVNLSQDFAGAGGNVRFVRTTIDTAWYHGFMPGMVLTVQGQAGDTEPWGGDYVRINDRSYKGADTFRGFQVAGIGRDTLYGDALGGKVFAIGTVELSFPNGLPEQYGINTALFSDVGTLGVLDAPAPRSTRPPGVADPNIRDDLALRASAGITVYWKSPMGPLRFDISQVLKRETYDRTEQFQFPHLH